MRGRGYLAAYTTTFQYTQTDTHPKPNRDHAQPTYLHTYPPPGQLDYVTRAINTTPHHIILNISSHSIGINRAVYLPRSCPQGVAAISYEGGGMNGVVTLPVWVRGDSYWRTVGLLIPPKYTKRQTTPVL